MFYSPPKENEYRQGNDTGTCQSDKFVYGDDIYPLNDKLEYWDYESYSAGFYVGQNFGCIHFQPRHSQF